MNLDECVAKLLAKYMEEHGHPPNDRIRKRLKAQAMALYLEEINAERTETEGELSPLAGAGFVIYLREFNDDGHPLSEDIVAYFQDLDDAHHYADEKNTNRDNPLNYYFVYETEGDVFFGRIGKEYE